ncbi:NAD-dependent epimerase/dehydratase family protein [Micromonospora saelicesensis]|uniref:NAD-dependent epimerase/dehydratase family protein n=1 Tax=Micromonospora saelicesensis TaxID=285676 RepID=UPI000DC24C38|nr:NAD-dependent epimerase/dehydratase family protein [Micromonospora saelicesensis]RAO54401.1 UDP-glucose 4-epimerase [Micromonospora saelicesensis]
MHVLVTGGLGFLGRAVARDLLAAGHRVTVMTRGRGERTAPSGVELVTGDIRDRARVAEIVQEGGYDGVVHLAALTSGRDSFGDPLDYFDVNTTGTLNLLMALDVARTTTAPASLVFASTNIVYGSQHHGALSEDLDPHPESPYAASKVAAEHMVAAYAATGAIGAVILRPFNVAGAVDGVTDTDRARIIPNVFRAITGELDHVTLNGDGAGVRDFVHVADVATAVRLALTVCTPGTSQTINLGSGIGTSMATVVATAEQITGYPVTVHRQPPKPEPPELIADISRAQIVLGWAPAKSRLSGILADAWEAWPRRLMSRLSDHANG